ncbi:MAG: hypothetical protein PHS57_09275 [Alphaproteobacteria bacterium]|nr:hypothetical protein [Alphaproteobacteria bacterium]
MRTRILFLAALAFIFFNPNGAAAQNAPVVTVRVGAHRAFDRIVFDWPQKVLYDVQRNGGSVSVLFKATGHIAYPKNLRYNLSRARDFETKTEGDYVIVTFRIDPSASIKSFFNETSVVLDIEGSSLVGTPPQRGKKAVDAPRVTASPREKVDVIISLPDEKISENKPVPQQQVENADVKPALAPRTAEGKEQSLALPPIDFTIDRPAKPAVFSFVLTEKPMLVATLDPHVATRAAIYLRAGVGYVVFDKKMTLSPEELLNGHSSLIKIVPFPLPHNAGYRFAVPSNATLLASLDGTAWKIYLSKKNQTPPVTTTLVEQPDFALGARLLLPLPDSTQPIRITDPVVGDSLILVPLAQSEAFNVERRSVDLEILPAAQGLVIKPLSDSIIARAVSDGIEITAEGGLLLSDTSDTGAQKRSHLQSQAALKGKSIFDFTTWAGKPGETFTQTRQRLQQTIVDVPEAERNRARMELARFYFAHGMGEEAAALLEALADEVPDLRFHGDFLALLGASKILAYHPEEGLADLSSPGLAGQPEITLWQGIALAQLRSWKQAEEKLTSTERILAGYPEPFFSRFFVLAIEAALAADQPYEAADWLHFVLNAPHAASINPALNFLRGVLDAKAGRAQEAEEAWRLAKNSQDRLYSVRAELALIDLGVAEGSLTPAHAADRLEALRFGWRGDDLEVDILRRLGQFYIQAKNLKAGINALAKAATLYPSSPLVPLIRTEMESTFRDIFIGTLGEQLSPLDTLSLYNQYRDLLPPGKESDAVVAGLAERLVSIDLLDQAAILLEDLAKNRLKGKARLEAISRLAAIRLLDHKPTQALDALALTGKDPIPDDIKNERMLLRARALSEMDQPAEVDALLKDNTSPGALLLRADLAMKAKQWKTASTLLMELVGPPPPENKSLSPDKASWLLNAAIACAMLDDQDCLGALARDYGNTMKQQAQSNMFDLLTQPESMGQMSNLAAAQAQLSQTDMFSGFLNSYRQAAPLIANTAVKKSDDKPSEKNKKE